MDFFSVLLTTGIARELEDEEILQSNGSESISIQIYKKNGSMDRLDYLPRQPGGTDPLCKRDCQLYDIYEDCSGYPECSHRFNS